MWYDIPADNNHATVIAMNKELKYNGYTAVPSDYECNDGDLAASIGIISEDGALKSILPPSVILQLAEGSMLLYIHEKASYKHYIVKKGTYIYWITQNGESLTDSNRVGYCDEIKSVNSVGNTLLVFSSDAINYYLWKNDKYISLGNHIPNVEVSFGLRGRPRLFSMNDDSKSTFTVSFDSISADHLFETWSESNQNKITQQVLAKVNKFLADQTVKKGKFALPFFVRYALRLYDGSLVCHSAPVLMNPSTKTAPIVFWDRIRGKGSYTEAICDIMLVAATLDYRLLADNESEFTKLKDWSDIIKSVDVFISQPIYTYDQNGLCKSFDDIDNFDTKFIGTLDFEGYSTERKNDYILLPVNLEGQDMNTSSPSGKDSPFGKEYVEWRYSTLYELYFSTEHAHPVSSIMLPEFSNGKNRDTLKDVANFYFLQSIEISELSTSERQDIVIDDEYLQSLVTREVMTDDYLTHDRLSAGYSYTYNARLNLSGVRRELFKGFSPAAMFAYASCPTPSLSFSSNNTNNIIRVSFPTIGHADISSTVYIKEDGNVYKVETYSNNYTCSFFSDQRVGHDSIYTKLSWGCYLFYPNANAFKMILRDFMGTYEINLKPHDFLNGAFAVLDYELVRLTQYPELPQAVDNQVVDMPNKIYTSEINNPFFFPLSGINTVGTGKILGISSAAKALSEGQFGQFPLYAFTTEGVWALEVSSTGTYSAKQPITRDVCINPEGITQLDSAVLFPTDRGIMLISGSQAQCISETINSEYPFNAFKLPGFDKLHDMLGHDPENDKCLPTMPFTKFLKLCRMVYDYVHQRVIVYASGITYAYVFSLKSKQWGMIFSNLVSNLNSYPEALAVDGSNNVVDFSKVVFTQVNCLYVTRPLKLDAVNIHKTIDNIIQRGNFRKGHVKSVLYGSRDLVNWHLVWSSRDHFLRGFRGTPYKYFRIAGFASLDADESIYGASVQFTLRQTNKPR